MIFIDQDKKFVTITIITCYKILAFSATLPAFSSAISKRQQQQHFSSANATLSYFSSRKISMDDTLLTYYQMRKNGLLPPFSVLDACGLKQRGGIVIFFFFLLYSTCLYKSNPSFTCVNEYQVNSFNSIIKCHFYSQPTLLYCEIQ